MPRTRREQIRLGLFVAGQPRKIRQNRHAQPPLDLRGVPHRAVEIVRKYGGADPECRGGQKGPKQVLGNIRVDGFHGKSRRLGQTDLGLPDRTLQAHLLDRSEQLLLQSGRGVRLPPEAAILDGEFRKLVDL